MFQGKNLNKYRCCDTPLSRHFEAKKVKANTANVTQETGNLLMNFERSDENCSFFCVDEIFAISGNVINTCVVYYERRNFSVNIAQ